MLIMLLVLCNLNSKIKCIYNILMIQNIEDVSTDRLRKMLGSVKRALNVKIGAISKMKKPELLNKITELKYKWNPEKQQLTTDSMLRKKSVVDLPPRVVRKPKPLTQEKKVKLLKKIINDNDKKKALTKKTAPKKEEPKKEEPKKALTKKEEKEELEFQKRFDEERKRNDINRVAQELVEKNKDLLINTPTNLSYKGSAQNKYKYLSNMVRSLDQDSIKNQYDLVKEVKEQISTIKKKALTKKAEPKKEEKEKEKNKIAYLNEMKNIRTKHRKKNGEYTKKGNELIEKVMIKYKKGKWGK